MTDCDKYKKKAYIGFLLFVLLLSFRVINFEKYFELTTIIISILVLGIFGLYLSMPYIQCINDYNNRHKPPFEK